MLIATEKNDTRPIPPGIYYGVDGSNFYDAGTNKGMGNAFYAEWRSRVLEFPRDKPIQAGANHD